MCYHLQFYIVEKGKECQWWWDCPCCETGHYTGTVGKHKIVNHSNPLCCTHCGAELRRCGTIRDGPYVLSRCNYRLMESVPSNRLELAMADA